MTILENRVGLEGLHTLGFEGALIDADTEGALAAMAIDASTTEEVTLTSYDLGVADLATVGESVISVELPDLWDEISEANPANFDEFEEFYAFIRSKAIGRAAQIVGLRVAEDMVQEAAISTWKNWRQGRVQELGSYFYRTLINKCGSEMRRRDVREKGHPRLRGVMSERGGQVVADFRSSEDGDRVEQLVLRIALIGWLATLAPRQREALLLRFVHDLSEAETAAHMGLSQGAVKCHTARGIKKLRLLALSDAKSED